MNPADFHLMPHHSYNLMPVTALPIKWIPDSGSGKSYGLAWWASTAVDLCHLQFKATGKFCGQKDWNPGPPTKDSIDHQPTHSSAVSLQANDIQKYPVPFSQGALWYNGSWIKSHHLEIRYNCTLLFTCATTAMVTAQLHVTIYKWQCSYSNFTNYREIAPTMLRGFHSNVIQECKNGGESYSNWLELVQAFGF